MIQALLLLLASTGSPAFPPPKNLDAEVSAVVAEWIGDYRSAPGDPPRTAVVRSIAVPKLAKRAVFIEVRDGGADGKIIFQRIIGFADRPDRVRNWAASYYFMDAAAHARLDRRPVEAAALGPDDIGVFSPDPGSCALQLFQEEGRFTLTSHKDMCHIVSRFTPGLVFHPEMRLTIGKSEFRFFEQGFFETGEPVQAPLSYVLAKAR